VVERKTGTNGRNKQVPDVGKIKAEHDAEEGLFKYRVLPLTISTIPSAKGIK
jgi:hypothetical protein